MQKQLQPLLHLSSPEYKQYFNLFGFNKKKLAKVYKQNITLYIFLTEGCINQ